MESGGDQVGVDAAIGPGGPQGSEASGDLQVDLDVPQCLFGEAGGPGHAKVDQVAQHLVDLVLKPFGQAP